MARLLIKAIDYVHPDPIIDRRASFKSGDIVAVMPDGHKWGLGEGAPKFRHVELPGLTVAEVQHLVTPDISTLEDLTSLALRKISRMQVAVANKVERDIKQQRRYRLDSDNNLIDKLGN